MESLLEICELRIDVKGSDKSAPIVKDIDLTVHRGEVVALIGESGPGKTTICLAALGYVRPGLRITKGISFLFISHDISTIASLAEEVVVMYHGSIVESGNIKKVLKRPEKPYTQVLMASVPHLRLGWLDEAIKERDCVLGSAENLVLAD